MTHDDRMPSAAGANGSPSAAGANGPSGPVLPSADAGAPKFGGFQFEDGPAPDIAGVFVLTRRIGDLLYPALIGEAENIAVEIDQLLRRDGVAAHETDGRFWIARGLPRQRGYILRELVGKYDPPLNIEHRKGRAAPELAALIPDRASGLSAGFAEIMAAPVVVSEDDIARLVREFYADAMADELLGPVFRRAVGHWDRHYKVVEDFWSRTLLGTTRYTGNPFSPHLALGLRPQDFDRWIELFRATATRILQPAAAQRAIGKVEHMGVCFQSGLFLPAPHDAAMRTPSAP